MMRISTSVNGSSLIQKLTCAFGCGCATWGTLDGAGCWSRSALLILRPPQPTPAGTLPGFRSKSLNQPVVPENCVTNRHESTCALSIRLSRTRATFIHKRHRFRAAHVAGLEPIELKAGALYQRSDRAVEMAAAAQALPDRGQPILPPAHIRIGRLAVLDEQQASGRPKHATRFVERIKNSRNTAQRPSRHDGVGARILEGNPFGRTF